MYAELTLKLRSEVTEDKLTKDAETVEKLNLDMSCDVDKFQTALHTLVAQNVVGLITSAFAQHPEDIQKVVQELQTQLLKEKKKQDEKKKDEKTNEPAKEAPPKDK